MNYGIIPLILRRYSCKITDWESLRGKWPHSDRNDVVVIQTDDNRLEIFLVGTDKVLYHRWQNAANGKWNSTWESLGGKRPDNSDSVVVVNMDGRIEVFMVGNDKALYHRWQTKPGGSWVW